MSGEHSYTNVNVENQAQIPVTFLQFLHLLIFPKVKEKETFCTEMTFREIDCQWSARRLMKMIVSLEGQLNTTKAVSFCQGWKVIMYECCLLCVATEFGWVQFLLL